MTTQMDSEIATRRPLTLLDYAVVERGFASKHQLVLALEDFGFRFDNNGILLADVDNVVAATESMFCGGTLSGKGRRSGIRRYRDRMAFLTMRYHFPNVVRSDVTVLWAAAVLVFDYKATELTFKREFGDYMAHVEKRNVRSFEATDYYDRTIDRHCPWQDENIMAHVLSLHVRNLLPEPFAEPVVDKFDSENPF